MAPVLDKASQLIGAKVTIAGVEVAALVDTGATTSCCRWGWYKKWKSHLGSLRHSSTMAVGVGNVPIEVKGLSKPLMLKWDSVEGQCQLMVLTTLTDVDVILGMDVFSQFDIKIDSRNQVASPERELCTSLILDENVKVPPGKSRDLHRGASCKTTFSSTESFSQGTGAVSGQRDAEGWGHSTVD